MCMEPYSAFADEDGEQARFERVRDEEEMVGAGSFEMETRSGGYLGGGGGGR